MTFNEIPLFDAVCSVRDEMKAAGESPGSSEWDTTEDGRTELTKLVMQQLIRNVDQRVVNAWIAVRKCGTIAEGVNKIELLVQVARMHGTKCFYANRGKGDCSEDVHLDRLVPGSRGGKYTPENCIIACGRHNMMRGDSAIEEFLSAS